MYFLKQGQFELLYKWRELKIIKHGLSVASLVRFSCQFLFIPNCSLLKESRLVFQMRFNWHLTALRIAGFNLVLARFKWSYSAWFLQLIKLLLQSCQLWSSLENQARIAHAVIRKLIYRKLHSQVNPVFTQDHPQKFGFKGLVQP